MAVVLTNALLVDLDPPRVERGSLLIQGNRIAAFGDVTLGHGDEMIDCGGTVVMPGMVNGHTHLYSALAVGMPAPPRQPKNFLEILQLVWWRLDRASMRNRSKPQRESGPSKPSAAGRPRSSTTTPPRVALQDRSI